MILVTVFLRALVQQLEQHRRLQERRQVRDKQEESHRVQILPPEKMYLRRHVEVRLAIRSQIELVQNSLSVATTAAARAAAAAARAADAAAAATAAASAASAGTLPAGYSHVASAVATAT